MKVTLDHNCLIDLANGASKALGIRSLLATSDNQVYLVNIGASEMRERGIRPDRYDLFEELLVAAGVVDAPRLDPALVWEVTFWYRSVWPTPSELKLAEEIEAILFGDCDSVDISKGLDSTDGKKWLNRVCDVQTLWCHIRNKNDLFLTSDKNFMKQSKLPRLLTLGVGAIRSPEQL